MNVADFNPLGAMMDIGSKLIDHFFPNPVDAAAAKLKLLEMQQNGQLAELASTTDLAKAQDAINAAEAASGNWWIAGGRPFIIWVCGFSLAWNYVVGPMLAWVLTVAGHTVPLPTLDMSVMMPVLLGLLGLSGMRTAEKVTKVNDRHG